MGHSKPAAQRISSVVISVTTNLTDWQVTHDTLTEGIIAEEVHTIKGRSQGSTTKHSALINYSKGALKLRHTLVRPPLVL